MAGSGHELRGTPSNNRRTMPMPSQSVQTATRQKRRVLARTLSHQLPALTQNDRSASPGRRPSPGVEKASSFCPRRTILIHGTLCSWRSPRPDLGSTILSTGAFNRLIRRFATQGRRHKRAHQQRRDRRCAGTEDRQCRLRILGHVFDVNAMAPVSP